MRLFHLPSIPLRSMLGYHGTRLRRSRSVLFLPDSASRSGNCVARHRPGVLGVIQGQFATTIHRNQEEQLSHRSESPGAAKGLSLDTWAVIVALALALLVRLGVIQKVPW
jgi:hypothetical protein